MYQKVSPDMNFVEREKKVEKFWEENHIFEKSMENREGCPELYVLRRPAHRQRQASYRPCADPRHQGHDSPLPHYEGLQRAHGKLDGIPTACRWSWR